MPLPKLEICFYLLLDSHQNITFVRSSCMTSSLSSASVRAAGSESFVLWSLIHSNGFNPQHVYRKGLDGLLSRTYIIGDPFSFKEDDSGAQNGEEDQPCTHGAPVVVLCDNPDSCMKVFWNTFHQAYMDTRRQDTHKFSIVQYDVIPLQANEILVFKSIHCIS